MASNEKLKTSMKNNSQINLNSELTNNNLSLYGSHIQLNTRELERVQTPSQSSKKLFAIRQRPMSAAPALTAYKRDDVRLKVNGHWFRMRPQSADNVTLFKKKKLTNSVNIEQPPSKLPSSKLLEKLVKEPVMRSWATSYYQAVTPGSSIVSDATEDNSDAEEIPDINSEISFGTKIQNLAQKNLAMNIEPGVKHKPPLPRRSSSPKKEAPPTVSMSKAYQDRFYNQESKLSNVTEERSQDLTTDNVENVEPVDSKLDLYFKQWGDAPPTPKEEVKIFEQETDLLFEKLRSHQKAFSDYVDDTKSLPNAIEEVVEIQENVTEIEELTEFSLNDYDERLKQDQEFLETQSVLNSERRDLPDGSSDQLGETKVEDLQKENTVVELPERDTKNTAKNLGEFPQQMRSVLSSLPSTYEDIASILHFLEDEDKSEDSKQTLQKQTSFSNDFKEYLGLSGFQPNNDSDFPRLPEKNTDLPEKSDLNIRPSQCKNYAEILTFLDEVDRSCAVILNAAKMRAYNPNNENQQKLQLLNGSRMSMEHLLKMNPIDLAHEIMGMSLEIEEKSSSIKLLQDALAEHRTASQKIIKTTELEAKKRFKSQKDEFEAVVKRHQKFIDQVIKEKKALSEQCESLVKQLKQQEDRHCSAIKAAEHRFSVEMQRVKDMQAAGEKMRREKWLQGKTEKIKEMTVKGLEPELNNMQMRHQTEITNLRSMHKQEIEELELRAARKAQQQCELLREQLNVQHDEILTKEREIQNQRIQKIIENEEKNYQEQRRHLIAENERLKQRLEDDTKAKIADCESKFEAAVREKERAIEVARTEFQDKLDTLSRKHKNELTALKEKYEIEQETWKASLKKEQAVWQHNKEAEIRAQCKRERDREIEIVIDRLESESSDLKSQMEMATENRIKRLTEKFNTEIKFLEESEKQAQARFLEIKNTLVNNENDLIYLRNTVKQLEFKLAESEKLKLQLEEERGRVREVMRKELEQEMATLQSEILHLRAERENEMQQVYNRVRLAITRKDEAIGKIKEEYTVLQEKYAHLEQLLQTQRKTFILEAN